RRIGRRALPLARVRQPAWRPDVVRERGGKREYVLLFGEPLPRVKGGMSKDRRRVLVVDDDRDLREVLVLVLEEAGYVVDAAENGEHALEAFKCQRPDLILLDMKMPVMDGWAFARELLIRFPDHPPIVVITASERAPANAAEIGAVGWLGKPFNLKDVLDAVPRYLTALPHSSS